jgi:ribosomal protein L32
LIFSFSAHAATDALRRVFFSDDGSTAMEAGLKMILQSFAQNGQSQRPQFVSPDGAYHGDTVGAMSLSHSDSFHRHFQPVLFPTKKVMTPSCYRCPFNRAKPENADARSYRKCNFECATLAEEAIPEVPPAPVVAAVTTAHAHRVTSAAHVLTHMITGQSDAPSCPNCGHIAVRNGACYKCLTRAGLSGFLAKVQMRPKVWRRSGLPQRGKEAERAEFFYDFRSSAASGPLSFCGREVRPESFLG